MSKSTGCAVFLLLSALLWAQFGASLQGTVTDTSGAVVPNAKVTLTNTEGLLSREWLSTVRLSG